MVKNKLIVLALFLFATITFLSLVIANSVSFENPTEASDSVLARGNIIVNVTSNFSAFSNMTIELFNSSALVNFSISENNETFLNFTNLPDEIYFFNASVINSTGWTVVTETRNVTIDTTKPVISFDSPSSSAGSQTAREILVNISVTESNLDSITVNISNSTWSNKTVANQSPVYLNFSNKTDGDYSISVVVNDSAGNTNSTTRSITIDTIAPNISLISPSSGDTWDDDSRIIFYFNVTDASGSIANCSVYIDDELNETDDDIDVNVSQHIHSTDMENNPYDWFIRCYDSAGNYNDSSEWSVDLEYDTGDDSSSGGGGGGDDSESTFWTNTYSVNKDDFVADGFNKVLSKRQRMKVFVGDELHYVGVTNVGTGSVEINVSSTPQEATIYVGETKKFEVDTDGYYDLSVELNSVNGTKANITVLYIHEKMAETAANDSGNATDSPLLLATNQNGTTNETSGISSAVSSLKNNWLWILIGVLVVIVALIVIFWKKIWFVLSNLGHRHK